MLQLFIIKFNSHINYKSFLVENSKTGMFADMVKGYQGKQTAYNYVQDFSDFITIQY